jgi:hypothetical protein
MTEGLKKDYKLTPHALVEMWIDDYVMLKNNKSENNYYKMNTYMDEETQGVINDSYNKVFKRNNVSSKYRNGIFFITRFERLRCAKDSFIEGISSKLKIGNIFYNRNINKVTRFLNLKHEDITNPITGETFNDSFDDLWNKSLMIAGELIDDVNRYLYYDKPLNNYYILNDISYNTGLPCRNKEVFKYVKKYK